MSTARERAQDLTTEVALEATAAVKGAPQLETVTSVSAVFLRQILVEVMTIRMMMEDHEEGVAPPEVT